MNRPTRKIFSLLLFCLLQSMYAMENEDKGFFSQVYNTLYSYTLYFPFCNAVELAEKNGFSVEDCEIIKKFIIKGADFNWKVGKYDETVLSLAIEYQNQGLFKFLLQRKANVNAMDDNGTTPLALALCNKNSVEVIKELCNAGASLTRSIGDIEYVVAGNLSRLHKDKKKKIQLFIGLLPLDMIQ